VSQRGSHQKWRHANGRQVIVAMHGSKPIPIGTLKSIIEGSGLAPDDFRESGRAIAVATAEHWHFSCRKGAAQCTIAQIGIGPPVTQNGIPQSSPGSKRQGHARSKTGV
jgi:hypothetical protein